MFCSEWHWPWEAEHLKHCEHEDVLGSVDITVPRGPAAALMAAITALAVEYLVNLTHTLHHRL